MQRTRLMNRGGFRFEIASLALVLLAPAYLLHAQAVQAPTEALARIRQAGVLRLGYYPNAQPFSYQDGAGRPAGYAVALCQEIATLAEGFQGGLAKMPRAMSRRERDERLAELRRQAAESGPKEKGGE